MQTQYAKLFHENGTAFLNAGDFLHAEHCFRYLRNAAECSFDMTLEPPDQNPVKGMSPLRGYGVEHQCRNRKQVLGWMRENAAVPDD
jgi:hypothetical protein